MVKIEEPKIEEEQEVEQQEPSVGIEERLKGMEAAAERLEAANKRTEELLVIQKQEQIERTLGGQADAASKEVSPEQKIIESSRAMLKGTGFEDVVDYKE